MLENPKRQLHLGVAKMWLMEEAKLGRERGERTIFLWKVNSVGTFYMCSRETSRV